MNKNNWQHAQHIAEMMYNAAPCSLKGLPPNFLFSGRGMNMQRQMMFSDVELKMYAEEPDYNTCMMRSLQAAYLTVQQSLPQAAAKVKYDIERRPKEELYQKLDRV